MFVWIFHRVSGVLLIFLLAVQLFSGFFQEAAPSHPWAATITAVHQNDILNCLIVFLVVFHALYGLRTILMDLGVARERLLFWGSSLLGLVIFAVFVVVYFTIVLP